MAGGYSLGSTMRIFEPHPGVIAFYDGRIPGIRAHGPGPNWLDDGAFTLGTASFVIHDGDEALVYDTHMSIAHAELIRAELEREGLTKLRVILSHWHTDHVAGNAVFADCEIIASPLTMRALVANRDWLENNDPPIKPLVMPTTVLEGETRLMVGRIPVDVRFFNIHSNDGTVLLLPESRLLLAGDTLEDTVTYVVEPEGLETHLSELGRMRGLEFDRILPNHGSLERIARAGYDQSFITATELYVQKLLRVRSEPELATLGFRDFISDALATGGVDYFEAYEPVHQHNLKAVTALAK